MEQHEEASEGVFAQEIVVPLTEILQQDVKQVLSAVTEHHMESENKSISGDARAKRLNGFLMTCQIKSHTKRRITTWAFLLSEQINFVQASSGWVSSHLSTD